MEKDSALPAWDSNLSTFTSTSWKRPRWCEYEIHLLKCNHTIPRLSSKMQNLSKDHSGSTKHWCLQRDSLLEGVLPYPRAYTRRAFPARLRWKRGMHAIAIHVLHWEMPDFKMIFYPNRWMRAVQNWAYMREDTVYSFKCPRYEGKCSLNYKHLRWLYKTNTGMFYCHVI